MSTMRRLCITIISSLALLAIGNTSFAEHPAMTGSLQIIEGTINNIDTRENMLLVNDAGYYLAKDLVIKNVAGNPSRLSALYRGKRIRMEVEFSSGSGKPGTIHTIYMMR
jgi:hypothetical protein